MSELQAAIPPREYETIYILRPDAGVAASEKVAERVRDVITKEQGTLTRVENWGYRKLAYPVRKLNRGVYVYLKFIGGGALVTELARNLRIQEPVLKFQTVATGSLIDPENLDASETEFEHLESMAEDPEDESRARELGLDDTRSDEGGRGGSRNSSSSDSESDDEESEDNSEEKESD